MKFSRQQIWEGALFVVSVVYLIYELAFNSRIVDGASGEFSSVKLEALELQGRILSGIGISLLALRLIKIQELGVKSFASKAILVTFFSFSFMFLGQKFLLDTLVESSTEESRNDAMYVAMLKSGVFNGSVQLDDINIEDEDLDSASTRSMLAIMGAMLFNSNSFIEDLKQQVDEVIDKLAEQDARKTLPQAYAGYKEFQEETAKAWSSYADAVNKYNIARSKSHAEAVLTVDDIYINAANEYTANTKSFSDKEILTKSLEIKRSVSKYFYAKSQVSVRCKYTADACHIKIEDAYRDTVIKEAGRYIAPDYWCYPPEEIQVTEKIRGRLVSKTETVQDCESMSREFIERKLRGMLGEANSFLDSPKVAREVVRELQKENISLPSGWVLRDRGTLETAVEKTIAEKVELSYREGVIDKTGEYIPPNLTQEDFIALPMIQEPIKEALDYYPPSAIGISLSPEVFLQKIHKLKFREVYEEKRDILLQDGEYFGDGELMEDAGKNYYKSIVIPPFAMSFSLFFGLLNLTAFLRTLLNLKLKKSLLSQSAAWTLMLLGFVVVPTAISSDAVESKAFKYFKGELSETNPNAVSYFAAWVINTQPIVYPIGNFLAGIAGQELIEKTLEDNGNHTTEFKVKDDAESLFEIDDDYQIPGLDISLESDASTSVEKEANVIQSEEVVYYRQNESNRKSHAYSRNLVGDTLSTGNGLMIDFSPIGGAESEKWVAYDKPFYGNDICLPGRRINSSLSKINDIQWRNGVHGSCVTAKDSKATRLPSDRAIIRTLAKRQKNQPLIISLQEDITGEVYCRRYDAIIERILTKVGTENITLSTPSIRILSCYESAPEGVDVAFEMPMYSATPDSLLAKGHKYFTRAEYVRVKKLMKGGKPTISSIDTNDLGLLLDNHPYVTRLIVDRPLLSKDLYKTVKPYSVKVLKMSGRTIKGEF